MTKILIIRLSSIGDIIQCMGVIGGIRHQFPDAQLHWVARSDMAQTLAIDGRIDKIWTLDKGSGFGELTQLTKQLKAEKFDYIYDAHLNLRSLVMRAMLGCRLIHRPRFAVRSKDRIKRVLLFNFGINRFDWPFVGATSFRKPLKRWGITEFDDSFADYTFPEQISAKFGDLIKEQTITLVPSANWEMKRWPVSHWRSLIELLPECNFVVLAGPTDHFCEEICAVAPDRVVNMAGKSSIMESSYIVAQSRVVVSGDTGFMHLADLLKVPTVALIGPTAFGFPARPSTETISLGMRCQPCTKDGRGGCKDSIYQRCLVEITPQRVAEKVRNMLSTAK